MNITIETIIEKIKKYNPSSNALLIREAYELAADAHSGQTRDSGEPYILHPLEVTDILTTLNVDDETIITGLLHDIMEDTHIPPEEIERRFGETVLKLVDGVTKLNKLEFRTRHEAQAENLRKMFMAMSSDMRIVLVKLADRLHNMRTISSHRSEMRQKEISEETLTLYAPLAHRLGIFNIKSELEDLSIEVLEPEKIHELKLSLEQQREERDQFINDHIRMIHEAMEKSGIKAEIKGRAKNYYSIFNKMRTQKRELSEIFDLNAIRIIVDSVRECYESLGIIHAMWKPIPGRFKDYIAMPKANLYQSIHTTLIAENGVPFEVQIRTWEMHRTAEFGVAAHWRYKEGGKAGGEADKKVEWLRQMLEWDQEDGDSRDFMENVKSGFFDDNLYVFSPKGDVIELPSGSIPLDFAYRIHTQVGHQCVGARVNHRLVPLETKLQNGDIVEILTAKGRGPSRDWLKICRTQQAKNKIRQWFRKEKREENIILGKDMIERECKKIGSDTTRLMKEEALLEIAHRFTCNSVEDLYAAVAEGVVRADTVVMKLKDSMAKELPASQPIKLEATHESSTSGVIVEGINNPMVRLAACCKPLPGEDIIGYVTRGRGVSVHRSGCPNSIRYAETEPERIIDVYWGNTTSGVFQVEIEIIASERERLLMEVMNIMAETRTMVNGLRVSVDRKSRITSIFIKLEVKSLDQLDYLMQRIARVKDVVDVHRLIHQKKDKDSKEGEK